ncbi:MAG: Type 1 glutamine amidotransferase-like domain-containing protein [DPANN group archaeon]|nr:Type 1 glutamine amidotransferase-like domain-containing protein [DPANN group archaeon]
MKLLLTSKGLTTKKIKNAFLALLEKPISKNKVLIMHTAKLRRRLGRVKALKKSLIKLGIKKQNIIEADISTKVNARNYTNFDVFYSCGGNTFYILDRMKKTGFDKLIKRFVRKNKLYVGVSAGSYIICPTIEAATWKHADKNIVGLKDLTALNIVPFIVTAHYTAKLKNIIDEAEDNTKYEVKRLTNRQALIVLNNKVRKIE